MKAVLIMDMPETCRDCKWYGHIVKFCLAEEECVRNPARKPEWCPIKKMPETISGHPDVGYMCGWNSFREQIITYKEE